MHLLNTTLQYQGEPDVVKINTLLRYCAVRQTQKLQQRLRRHPLNLVRSIMKDAVVSDFTIKSETFPGFDVQDEDLMPLISLSPSPPDARGIMFFEIWNFISETLNALDIDLGTLKKMKGPELLESEQHDTALYRLVQNLIIVNYISWGSVFFTWFLNKYLPQVLERRMKRMKIPGGKALFTGHPPVYENKNEAYEHDPEVQVIESSLPDDDGRIGEIQKALRLVSSLIHHTAKIILNKRLAGQQVDFDVLTYSHPRRSEASNREDTIIRLFPNTSSNIIGKIGPLINSKGPPNITMTAPVHCEALLGALRWRLRNMPSNSNFPVQLFFQQSYPLLAVSRRCCPVCAITLSHLNGCEGFPNLLLYAKHSVIFPCAFPPYLPKPTRDAVIKHLENLLVLAVEIYLPSKKLHETQSNPFDSSSEGEDKIKMDIMKRKGAPLEW